ncbi:UNVERIFIED_CONTAM: hypothetical protein GTU68_001291 [Idotea baltica]|nr:hypothetical protein [Idotea baltica]
MVLNEFDKPKFETASCSKQYVTTGSFTCIYVEFILERKFGFYLIYTYLPSILIVIISWVSFFIDYQAVPARISLGLLSILSLITQSAATLQKLPRVSYVKAIDVWLFACLAFVVISLLEFAVVNVLARRQEKFDMNRRWRRIIRDEIRQAVPWALENCLKTSSIDLKCTPGTATTSFPLSPSFQETTKQFVTNTTIENHNCDYPLVTEEAQDLADYDEDNDIWKRNGSHITNPGHTMIFKPASRRTVSGSPQNVPLKRFASRRSSQRETIDGDDQSLLENPINDDKKRKYQLKGNHVDKFCVFAFPTLFIFFNAVYWLYYLSNTTLDEIIFSNKKS